MSPGCKEPSLPKQITTSPPSVLSVGHRIPSISLRLWDQAGAQFGVQEHALGEVGIRRRQDAVPVGNVVGTGRSMVGVHNELRDPHSLRENIFP